MPSFKISGKYIEPLGLEWMSSSAKVGQKISGGQIFKFPYSQGFGFQAVDICPKMTLHYFQTLLNTVM